MIILDVKDYFGPAIIGIAALIVAIAVAYYFLNQPPKPVIDDYPI